MKGEFVWHDHANEDELFMVIKGQLLIRLKNEKITLNEGETYIVPKGIEHKPIATDLGRISDWQKPYAITNIRKEQPLIPSSFSSVKTQVFQPYISYLF